MIIRSTKHTLKYTNANKLVDLSRVLAEYRRVAQILIDRVWSGELAYYDPKTHKLVGFDPTTSKLDLPKYLAPGLLKVDTWLSARLLQCCGKQVLGMLNAAVAKQRKRFYVLAKEQRKQGNYVNLQSFIDHNPIVKPSAAQINMELDGRFVDLHATPDGEFDLFLRLSSLGNKLLIKLPIKHHKRSRHWMKRGTLKSSIRVGPNYICLLYDIDEPTKKQRGRTLGCDQGYLDVATFADQSLDHVLQTPKRDIHGHTMKSICEKIARCQPGSKGMARARAHRTNFVNWCLNQVDFRWVKQVNLEEVKGLRYKQKQFNHALMHWTYTDIRSKLLSLSEEKGFLLTEQASTYRSQRCSKCGWVLKANRLGKTFHCAKCGFKHDADVNAASNHVPDLPEIPYWVRQKKMNRSGFYWTSDGLFSDGHEPIVRDTHEPTEEYFS